MIQRFALAALFVASPLLAQAPAANAPQPLAKTFFTGKIDEGFKAIDTNKDGFIDQAEMAANDAKQVAAAKAMLMRESEVAFKQLDKDNNGSLSLAEFNAVAQSRQVRAVDPVKVIAAFDTNKDGKISMAENRAPRVAEFDKADTNKDGTLTVAEQQAASQQRRR